jgi:type IV secretory pathway TrbD component
LFERYFPLQLFRGDPMGDCLASYASFMKPAQARTLLLIVAIVGVVAGLVLFGASNQYEANLGVGLFAVGGVAGVIYLGLIASRELRR